MRLYITADGHYAGTQADAGKDRTQVEVPTDKAGLIAYLNEIAVKAENPAAERVSSVPALQVAKTPPSASLTVLEAFILDEATVAEVEQLFMRLGTRFAELRKGSLRPLPPNQEPAP